MSVVHAARDWLLLIRQHRTFAIGGLVVGSLVFLSLAAVWPKHYKASVAVAIDPAYTLQADAASQLRTIKEAISQATTKQDWAEIIAGLGLYPKTIANGGLDHATADLASQVSITPGNDPKLGGLLVRVAYSGRDPRLVVAVVNAVAENLTRPISPATPADAGREPGTSQSASFQPLRSSRIRRRGEESSQPARSLTRGTSTSPEIPKQLRASIAEGFKLQTALNENTLELDRLRERLSQEDAARSQQNSVPQSAQPMKTQEAEPPKAATPKIDPQIERLQQDLAREQHTLADLRSRYTDDYPDVVAERERVNDLQTDLSRLAAIAPREAKISASPAPIAAQPAQANDPIARQQLAQQVAAAEATHDRLQESLARNRALAAGLQATVAATGIDPGDSLSPNQIDAKEARPPALTAADNSALSSTNAPGATSSLSADTPEASSTPRAGRTMVLAQGPVVTASPFLFAGRISWLFSGLFGLLTAAFAVWLAERRDPSIRNEGMLRNELPASALFLGGIPRVRHEVVSN